MAELMETPVMLVVTVVAARRTVHRLAVPSVPSSRRSTFVIRVFRWDHHRYSRTLPTMVPSQPAFRKRSQMLQQHGWRLPLADERIYSR